MKTTCLVCGHVCETDAQFREEWDRGLWCIQPSSDGYTWEDYHYCDRQKEASEA